MLAIEHAPELRVGGRLAITGPSGSGKTTLLLELAERYDGATFFAEDAHPFSTTVRDNLLVVDRARRRGGGRVGGY